MPLSYAAEWLLDNFFVVQQAIRQVREDLPPGYYRELPKLSNPDWANIPRNYALAHEIIAYTDNQLEIEQTVRYVQAFQADVPLTMGELWAFPTMLRMGILSSLANSLAGLLHIELPSLTSAVPAAAGDNAVRFCITSLRLLAVQDWKVFFERVSLVDQILRLDPVNVYSVMDFDTRNSYRGVIERLARFTKQAEEVVTQQAISLSREAALDSRSAHVGYFLLGEGYQQLEDKFHYRASKRLGLRRLLTGAPDTHLSHQHGITHISADGGLCQVCHID